MRDIKAMRRWQADLVLLIIAIIWGSTFFMIKNVLPGIGPMTFVSYRFGLSAVFLLAVYFRRLRLVTKAELVAGSLVGSCLGAGYVCQTIGLQFTSAGKAGFITGLNVVMVPVFAALLFRHRAGFVVIAGVITATMGLGFLSLNSDLRLGQGDLWILGCALAFALQVIGVYHFSRRYDPTRLAVIQIAAGAVIPFIAALIFEAPLQSLPVQILPTFLYVSLIATALAFVLQMKAQAYTLPTHAGLILGLESVFAAIFGWWFAGEHMSHQQIVGCVLIGAGVLIVEWPVRAVSVR